MEVVFSVDAYSFLVSSDLVCRFVTLRIQEYLLSGYTVPDNEDTELRSSNQEASPSASKNTRVVLGPCRALKCVPTAISGGVDISEVPGCHLLRQMSSQ